MSLFIPISSTVVYGCAVLLDTSSLIQSVLIICLSPVSLKTVLTLIGFHKSEARKTVTTVRVDAKQCTLVK
ncbi:unnamed protein product [Auanema sp. JU1783]|nr:unnamed protein product [Auanema sp. JU1783]